jgi:spoIIIJ-associated protein
MGNFFSKLFGRDKSKNSSEPIGAVHEAVEGIIARAGFDLEAQVSQGEEGILINFTGNDAGLVTDREGMLLDSFQIFIKRMLQNRFSDQKIEVHVDCDGFMEDSAQELRDLADNNSSLFS